MSVRVILSCALAVLVTLFLISMSAAQTTISGDVTGIVSDPSGAVLPNAQVTLKSTDTGQSQTVTTNGSGVYRFSLLKPGSYTVSANATGFQTTQQAVTVSVGQATALNLQLAVTTSGETVEVSAEGAVVQTQNGNISTTFTPEQVAQVPNPGNDLSYIVQTAPGAVMNTQAGYGNTSTFGLPATSNLYTVNGQNENDPFLNLNNSGATNLLLGQNDVQEVSVVNNGYSGQYGQLAGANVNYVTKSGTNKFHGNAVYYWNGRIMNANNWFNNDAGVDRPFVNANQWGASFGGPIVKDKTFFFINTEGLRVLLPTSTRVLVPSPEYQSATLANLATVSPDSIPFYNQMFSLWNNAPGASAATPIASSADPTGCGGFVGPGGLGTSVPCALQFRSTAGNFTHEWLLTGRVDQNLGAHDRAFVHFRTDHGVQATYTDPINPAFNAQSTQPQYEGQLNETHTFGSSSVNQFILSGSWYSALFSTANLAQSTALMPFQLRFAGRAFYDLGDLFSSWPQGRNVSQYQIVDDFSTVRGNHNFKFGVNFRRNDITDYSPGVNSIGFSQAEDLGSFFNGVGVTYQQTFPVRLTQPIALYSLSLYGQDEWSVKKNLRLTISLRAQHDSNPVCQTNCFARFDSSFLDIAHDVNTPYNSTIQTGLNQALRNYTSISWQPRLGFAWTPFGPDRNTVFRGGVGLFSDVFPATVVDNFLANPPVSAQFVVGQGLLDPSQAGSQSAIAAGANSSFRTGFANGGTLASISAANPLFTPPSMFNAQAFTHAPQYQEWNLEFQQGLGRDSSLSLNYVGNHGIYEASQNAGLNAFCSTAPILPLYPTSCASALGSPTGFAGLPTTPPDERFGPVTEVRSDAVSNYNGLTVSFRRRFASLQLQANYTWSHALDEISNAGFLPFNFNTNTSVLQPQDPTNLKRYNYGNADYDVRHYFSLNYVYNTPKLSGWKGALANWTVSGTLFTRTGYPYTVIDSGVTGTLQSYNYGQIFGTAPSVFADYTGDPTSCGRSALTTACPDAGLFSSPVSGFGNQRRNQIYGPSFFDTDLTIMKNFKLPVNEVSQLSVGLQFFNILNHPNFDQPVQDFADPQFGTIINTVNVPTSILGSFLGGDASPRLIQIKASFSF